MQIEHVFIDLDNTLLDFYATEDVVLAQALQACGIAPNAAALALYERINVALWQALEQGLCESDEIGERRFVLLLEALGISGDARKLAATYEGMLVRECHFMPGAEALLDNLHGRYRLHLATNGMAGVQYGRIKTAGIGHYFEHLFVSGDLGAAKPQQAFFDACFAQIPGFDKRRAVILGDGLASDICGGQKAGIATIWYNPQRVQNTTSWRPDAEVHALGEVPPLLVDWEQQASINANV